MSNWIRVLTTASALLASTAVTPVLAQASFIDHRGKLIELEKPPENLVSIIASGPIVYYSVDEGADHIVGVNENSYKSFSSGIHGQILPELLDRLSTLASDDSTPNVEAILALKPDLVMQWTHNPKIIEPLERVGLKVVGWGCCTEAQRRDYLTFSGYISGRNDRAQSLLQLQDESNAALRAQFAGLSEGDTVNILEVDKLGDQIQVVANSSQEYALSGVRNLASDGTGEWWRQIDAEQFLVWNPKIIIIPAWEPNLQPSDFYANALLSSVDAIKEKRVYKVPKFNAVPDAAEVYLTAAWLAALAHPDTVEGSFRDTVQGAYKTIYGKDISEDQLDLILESAANNESDGYAQLFG